MENKEQFKQLGFKYGGFYALLYILILVIEESFALKNHIALSIGGLVLSFLIVWQATNDYRNNGDGSMELSQALKIGLAIGVIGGLGYAIYMYLNYSFINTEFLEKAHEEIPKELQKLKDNGQIKTDEEIEMATKTAYVFASPFMLATIALIGQLIKTFIFSLIIGLIGRGKRQ
ncbi:DUF4199 domain-containing protein [Psychroflexus salis]|uniref:DUF4199 domain-containing protein n=1 Tax=Psychroflexus salis TaxID=1526574 RepID=A0A916ZRI7_9FLAO|nr:DUF4199 domain-containing protein [Psychroflexus salis]GGE10427.1 hypothetical protein GCM10010831_09930 [Psychroflexus salis]